MNAAETGLPTTFSYTRGLTAIPRFSRVRAMIDVVCGVIEDDRGRLLACLRPQGKHLAGMWEFPGGKVDPGESHEVALIRELREELGIEVTVGTALDPVHWEYERGSIRLLPFRCVIRDGEPRPIEHERVLWCAPGDFGELSWAAADLPILEQLRSVPAETPD